jgi:hypothetical protein
MALGAEYVDRVAHVRLMARPSPADRTWRTGNFMLAAAAGQARRPPARATPSALIARHAGMVEDDRDVGVAFGRRLSPG